jgi:hypothetical protein
MGFRFPVNTSVLFHYCVQQSVFDPRERWSIHPSIHPSIQLSLLQYYDRLESLRLRCLSQLRETEIVFQHEFMSLDSSFSVDWKSVRAQD